ncbi:uncharacterized protein LOC111713247 isoform X2 [Eurytemora carolleeae]|uniref:uncharacterized protein LOC111713247 isoform X2 n=1 Tax=Eurytemora carolleeae TaxID=1294199 RepID=UPI000C77EEF9|nr:uncharacterized protein LOC111713247 isoform X2 [Eurytemora carolleeae]|eukprot:XP_023343846.1 uncharacterized protein LOC111713247 isoform X2 [Eurytemora affinis]
MKNQVLRSLCFITIIVSLVESKTYLVETDDITGNEGHGQSGDDYTNYVRAPEPWEDKVTCEKRVGDTLCPEYTVCKKHKCIIEEYEKPWEIREIPCAERIGEFKCPEDTTCKEDFCEYNPEPWESKVPCSERVGNFTCPEFYHCKIHYCVMIAEVPCAERTGELKCPEDMHCEVDHCEDISCKAHEECPGEIKCWRERCNMYAPEDAEPIHEWPGGKFEAFLEEYKDVGDETEELTR